MAMSPGGDGGGSLGGGGTMLSEINITPLVDVMLVLLIIFMVTTPLLQQGVEVALPKASAPGLKSEETTLIITIDREKRLFMAQEEVDQTKLGETLQSIVAQNPDKQVFLKADQEVPYGLVAQVMATIKRSGVTRLGMVTQQSDEAAP